MIRGTCNFKQLEQFSGSMVELEKNVDQLIKGISKELAARLLTNVIQRTPVDTSTLRRGWTTSTEAEAAGGAEVSISTYVNSLPVQFTGNAYIVTIINPVHYASFVEKGHRTRNHKGWVMGRFMLKVSEVLVEGQAQSVIERHLQKYWRNI